MPKVNQIAVAEPNVTKAFLTPKPILFMIQAFGCITGTRDAGWGPGNYPPIMTLSPQEDAFEHQRNN